MIKNMRIHRSAIPQRFSLLIIAVGYESRSRHVAQTLGSRAANGVAFAFPSKGQGAFDRNLVLARLDGFEIEPVDGPLTPSLLRLLEMHMDSTTTGEVSVGIDVSSFTKFHIAEIVDALRFSAYKKLSVTFLYSPASSLEWKARSSPIRVAEPIHPAFASWTDDPIWPLTAIIGLGVEQNLALGVAEYLDVNAVYAFRPRGSDAGFNTMGEAANEDFLLVDYVNRVATYDLLDPFDLFTRLESLIYGLRPESRIAIVPLGPKIFALCALLATAVSDRATTVWRFSEGPASEPSDVKAAGPITHLSVEFKQ